MSRQGLLDLPFDWLRDLLVTEGLPAFRANQLWQGVFRDQVSSYEEITTLPKPLRRRLTTQIPWTPPRVLRLETSHDGDTSKLLLCLEDHETIETVIMRSSQRMTACVSTQVGCRMGCVFCATGRSGFVRNLTTAEIIEQVLAVRRQIGNASLSNIVYMGMGEPLDNYDATVCSIRILSDPRGLDLGIRNFTVSTVGVVPGIRRLASEGLQMTLAVSLHAAEDALRTLLVPANRRYPVAKLLDACQAYANQTHRRITFEITLIDGVNDSDVHAGQLAEAVRGMLCHVNLIPLNPISWSTWRPSPDLRVRSFADILAAKGVAVSIRKRRGVDIQAGCGQLRRHIGRLATR
jgi:23S rRNA (adenine2503-C2)-methyltransferase